MITLNTALLQMNDGIHHVGTFLMVDSEVKVMSTKDNNLDLGINLVSIPRDKFFDVVESHEPMNDDLLESIYRDYNSFAMELAGNRYFAWYNNDR